MNKKPALINIIWLFLILLSVVAAGYSGRMKETLDASFETARGAVELAIGLVGIMALWLGLMKVAEVGGLLSMVARAVRPIMVRLFPEVPSGHSAMSAMIMNISANVLGLGNAATPMGIKAMMELDKLNPHKGRATNAMALFLAINTSSVTILPLGIIGVRAAAGAADPASIIIPTLIATICSTTVAIAAAKILARRGEPEGYPADFVANPGDVSGSTGEGDATGNVDLSPPGRLGKVVAVSIMAAIGGAFIYRFTRDGDALALGKEVITYWLVPIIMCGLLLFGYMRGVRVYEAATDGAKEGFQVAIRIIPFLVMILVAIGMFRASGAFDILVRILEPLTSLIGMPVDALPVALMRPLSGTGSFGLVGEVVSRDPNGFSSFLVSTMQGSTETTFYVLAIYFGAIGVTRIRHTLAAALMADVAGIGAALAICHLMY
ncbi:MAG: nucleoside recognition domain-containing protein [Deltaproteobacteria bacterium]|nr:nucleoside recognition domain-containing protein [Deltaproteobacteria bacterium]